jgi:hypothetical protein
LDRLSLSLRLRLNKVVALVNAVADANAREVLLNMKLLLIVRLKVKREVDVDRVNPAVVLESTLADTEGELFVHYGR